MLANGMRQIEERHVANKIELMVWCNRMDLLALSNCKGEVQLHRLNWQRVWSLPPPTENSIVRGMVWRPDGKVLAVGYSCGTTYLVNVENKEILHTIININANRSSQCGSVTCLSWILKKTTPDSDSIFKNYDDASMFLPRPQLAKSHYRKNNESTFDIKYCVEQIQFDILLIGYENGELHMSVFGFFPCGIIDMKKFLNVQHKIKIINAQISDDLTSLHVFIENSIDNTLKLVVLDTEVLAAYSAELLALASKHGQMVELLSYTDQTMSSIIEAWEQILLEMDSKLEKYAAQVPEGGISADFLDLLMLGVPSTELELFLLRDLTAKGLKKFGTSVELSYSTIQKLVLKQLNTVGHDITYHLAELRGLARITHRYKKLGLEEETVTQAILSSSAFINKCLELQQVIDHAMKNYKAFFRWLYTVIVRLVDDHVPAEIVKITQQDLTYIAEFLLNFDKVGSSNSENSKDHPSSSSEKKGRFNLERLGQYLTDKEMTITNDDQNPWLKFLNENICIVENPSIVKTFKKFSLVQQQNHLKNSIYKVFNYSEKSLASHFLLINIFNCTPLEYGIDSLKSSLRISQINVPEKRCILSTFSDPVSSEKGFYFVGISHINDNIIARCAYFYFQVCGNLNDSKLDMLDGNSLKVLDVQFYSADVLSILLEQMSDESVTLFVQFPIELVKMSCKEFILYESESNSDCLRNIPKLNAFKMLEQGLCKITDKFSGWRIAVSGGRKVAVVLAKECQKVRLFEMEVDGEEDEDETLDTTPQSHSTTQHSDTSQHMSINDNMPLNMSLRRNNENPSESIEFESTYNF